MVRSWSRGMLIHNGVWAAWALTLVPVRSRGWCRPLSSSATMPSPVLKCLSLAGRRSPRNSEDGGKLPAAVLSHVRKSMCDQKHSGLPPLLGNPCSQPRACGKVGSSMLGPDFKASGQSLAHRSLWLLEAHPAHGSQASHDPLTRVRHVWHLPSSRLLPAPVWMLLKPSQAPDH